MRDEGRTNKNVDASVKSHSQRIIVLHDARRIFVVAFLPLSAL
jgi:hypothetical protein